MRWSAIDSHSPKLPPHAPQSIMSISRSFRRELRIRFVREIPSSVPFRDEMDATQAIPFRHGYDTSFRDEAVVRELMDRMDAENYANH